MTNEINNEDEKITVNMTDKEYDSLMQMFVESSLSKESIGTYHDYLNDGCSVTEALSRAVINEMVIRALIDKMERESFAAALETKDGK